MVGEGLAAHCSPLHTRAATTRLGFDEQSWIVTVPLGWLQRLQERGRGQATESAVQGAMSCSKMQQGEELEEVMLGVVWGPGGHSASGASQWPK